MNDADETSKPNSSASLVGTRVGDYQVLRKLGRGGMADVYAARHLSLGRDVALKVLRSDFARDQDYVQRFRHEARAAAKLNHPNIVQVFDVGSSGSIHYIAQELIDGENLREILDRRGPILAEEAVGILVGVAAALEVAAEAGITHRDIKPENIMRSSRDQIKVADFGLARFQAPSDASRAGLTQAGLTLGTPLYMSPEQVQGHSVDVRSDLYSLGISLYHLLSGRPPFEADEPLALAVMHLHETPIPLDRARNSRDADGVPELPEWLIAVISRLIRKLPQDRFQSPGELLEAVRNETSTSSIEGFGGGTAAATIRLQRAADQARRDRRRHRRRVAAAILLPMLCTSVAALAAAREKGKSVIELLRPDTVPQADTVQEQYLIAVTRNDEAGWRAIETYFPASENSTNAGYHAKAMLQLAQMLIAEQRVEEADSILKAIGDEATADRVYQALALVKRCRLLESLGGGPELTHAKRQLQTLHAELKTKYPSALQLFNRLVPASDRLRLEISGG